jgi:ATP/maltotriose-dependent transcriptional regulator MalT
VLLVAGAGYGKTLALQAAVAQSTRGSVWIRCGPGDADAGRLLRRVVEGVGGAVPGTVDVLAERLSAGGRPVDLRLATSELIDTASRRLDSPLIVVLDDAEQLSESAEGQWLAGELLTAPPEALRVALATRRPLELRLAKLRSAGFVCELGPGELAFTPDECGALLRSLGRPSDEAEARRLFESTDGWPLGAMLSAIHGDDPRLRGTGARSEVFEFLREELLATLPADLRKQVVESSVPRELDAGCLEALGLRPDLAERLEALGVPLRPVDQDGYWLAHHPLVREFLAEQLIADYDPESRRAMHARVAPALANGGRAEEAIDHWLEADRWSEAADAIARTGPSLLFVAPTTVRAWLDALPAEFRGAPGCQLLEGILGWEIGRNPEAAEVLRSAVGGYAAVGDVPGEWLARFALIDPLELAGEWEEAVGLADGFDDRRALAAGIVPPAVAAYAAAALGALGRMDECRALSRRILSHPHVGPIGSVRAIWEADMLIAAGEVDEAVAGAEAAVAEAERDDPFQRLMTFAGFLASAVTQQGRDGDALVLWARAEELARRAHMGYLASNTHAWMALLHARNGRLHPAEAHLARAGKASSEWRDAVAETARAKVAALRGDAGNVADAARRATALAERGLLTERFQAAIELAPALVDVGLHQQAAALIDEHLSLLDTLVPGPPGRYFRALLLAVRAWLRDAEGHASESAADLVRMWEEAGGNAPDVVRREWRLLEPLLWKALDACLLEPRAVVSAIARAQPGGEALVPLTAHPHVDVRRAAVTVAAGSGHPEVLRRIRSLASDADPELAAVASAAQRGLIASPPPLAFTLLGDFHVRRGQWWVADDAWDRRVAQRLVRHLLVARGRSVSEDLLLEAFWPEVSERSSRQRLRVAVSCARSVLDVPGSSSVIESSEATLRLRLRDRDSVDAEDFAKAAVDALAERGRHARALLENAVGLWTGEPLPQERYSDWAIPWREELIATYRAALTRLAQICAAEGDPAAAARAARSLVDQDPLDEEAQRLLIAAYARSGKRAHALTQYLDCRRSLVDALGIEPARETTALQQRVLAGEPV